MKEYTFTTYTVSKEFISGYAISEPKIIKAMSLKKAIKLFKDEGTFTAINWISKKGKDSYKTIKLPYQFRKERKGRLWLD